MARLTSTLFGPAIPFYFWLALGYCAFVGYVVGFVHSPGGDGLLYQAVERELQAELFAATLFSGNVISVTWSIMFLIAGFVCCWIEVVRATRVRYTGRNDVWSLIVTVIALVLFLGVGAFGTTAFLVVVVVGFGDVLLDRIVGQAVARRDFGGMISPGQG